MLNSRRKHGLGDRDGTKNRGNFQWDEGGGFFYIYNKIRGSFSCWLLGWQGITDPTEPPQLSHLCREVTAIYSKCFGDVRQKNGLKGSFCACPQEEFPAEPGVLQRHHRGSEFFFTQTLENPAHVSVATECPANRSDQMTSIRSSSVETGEPIVSRGDLGHSRIIFMKDFIPTL